MLGARAKEGILSSLLEQRGSLLSPARPRREVSGASKPQNNYQSTMGALAFFIYQTQPESRLAPTALRADFKSSSSHTIIPPPPLSLYPGGSPTVVNE